MAREEYEFWSGPYGNRELTRAIVDPDELRVVRDLDREQRVHFIEGGEELFPGVVATRLGGHTPGQLMVAVRGGPDTVILASDAAHYYEEIDRDRPFKLFDDLGDMYRALDILRERRAQPGTTVIPGHDPRVTAEFRIAAPDCLDLTAPVRRFTGRGRATVS
jgi:glyoxylase-like metal-dependent hydrolase (beta-lactamase superfamily II)